MIRGGFNVKALKGRFVNKEAILKPLQRAQYRGLKRIGAMERKIAKRSMRKGRPAKKSEWPKELRALAGVGRDKAGRFTKSADDILPTPMVHSKPGEPPKYYGKQLRDHIYFEVDVVTMSVVTGAAILPGVSQKGTPELMEHGGRREESVGEWRKMWKDGKPFIRLVNFERRSVSYPERAFMEPAQDEAVDQLVPRVWEESLR